MMMMMMMMMIPEGCCVHQDGYNGSLLCSSLPRHVLTM
jgi:hypothetical protein